ncbi:MAG: hypothetical protein ACLUNQ_06200 [Oscillospiraceae bacterium]
MFFLSVLQVLLDAERELLDYDPAWDFVPPGPGGAGGLPCRRPVRPDDAPVAAGVRIRDDAPGPGGDALPDPGAHCGGPPCGRHRRAGSAPGGVPLDLALVSGSAIGHDIGKFGCRPGERVPYLHYYYTDQWFRRRRMTDIGHVAANHSVWDLELDYLSVESLLLIYADFRVKQTRDDQGREVTKIFSLAEAFDVILSKLDAVDQAKRRRYELVYARLYDFEQFMVSRGWM